MITVTIFDAASGIVSRTLSLAVPEGEEAVSIALNLSEGEAYVDGDWPGDRWRISGGSPREMPERPGQWAAFDAGAWQWVDPRTAADLAAALLVEKHRAIAEVNQISGQLRSRHITVIPGQEMLYIQKESEAISFLSATSPNLVDYPLIAAEVGITAPSAYEVAQIYSNMAVMLRAIAAPLETLRLGTVAQIENAANSGEVISARAGFLIAAEGAEP